MTYPIAARITALESTREREARRSGTPVTQNHADVADLIDGLVKEYNSRQVAYVRRHEQDSTALMYLMGELENHVRMGGDPAILKMIAAALDFTLKHH